MLTHNVNQANDHIMAGHDNNIHYRLTSSINVEGLMTISLK